MSLQPKTLLQTSLETLLKLNAEIFLLGFDLYRRDSVTKDDLTTLKRLIDQLQHISEDILP